MDLLIEKPSSRSRRSELPGRGDESAGRPLDRVERVQTATLAQLVPKLAGNRGPFRSAPLALRVGGTGEAQATPTHGTHGNQ
jgi:hypothetical protein